MRIFNQILLKKLIRKQVGDYERDQSMTYVNTFANTFCKTPQKITGQVRKGEKKGRERMEREGKRPLCICNKEVNNQLKEPLKYKGIKQRTSRNLPIP